MKIIGLCGGSGSGKTILCDMLSERGYLCLNTDKIYHGLVSVHSECLDALVAEFGSGILTSGGILDRKKLAAIVFEHGASDKQKRLNEITHKYVLSEIRRIINSTDENDYLGAVVDAPLLFESRFSEECDFTMAVVASYELRIERICERDGISREEALRRISSQLPNEYLIEKCDFVIYNDSSLDSLKEQLYKVLFKIENQK